MAGNENCVGFLMRSAPKPVNEHARLSSLHELDINFDEPSEDIRNLCDLAARISGAPIALVSIVENDKQKFYANTGLSGVMETPRDWSFCAYAILESDHLIVRDTLLDDRFRDNPLVFGDPNIRSYLGVPLVVDGDARVGTLCVIDRNPRDYSDEIKVQLRGISGAVVSLLKKRRDDQKLEMRNREVVQLSTALTNYLEQDTLTGLTASFAFRRRVDTALRTTPHGSLLVVSIPDLREINRTHGHRAGDRCLQTVAHALDEYLSDNAIVGRLAGNEFAVFSFGDLVAVAELETRLMRALNELGPENSVSAEIRSAEAPKNGESFDSLYASLWNH